MRRKSIVLLLTFLSFLLAVEVKAAGLDGHYSPLVEKGRFLSTTEFSYFRAEEDGLHGGSAFDDFESSPDYPSIRQHFRFSPLDRWELGVGYGKDFNANYKRSTKGTSHILVNLYDLDFFHHYNIDLRRRNDRSEFYIHSYGNRQKAGWNVNALSSATGPDFFTTIRSHYENTGMGWRYLSKENGEGAADNLSLLVYPLLQEGQFNVQTELEYKRGKIERKSQFYGGQPAVRNYVHNLRSHFIPQVNIGLGIREDLEFRTGFHYELPHRFKFEFQQFNTNLATSRFLVANYKIKKKIEVPLSLYYRPFKNFQAGFSSDTIFAEQLLESYDKGFDGSLTIYPEKRLRYLNVKPTFELIYLFDKGKDIKPTPVNELTKKILEKDQFLINFKYQRDITHLRKNGANGSVNFLDTDRTFLFPLDNFVSGTEYAAHFTGNSSATSPDASPQNFHQVDLSFKYGLWENFNAGLGAGYRSRSGVHQFVFTNGFSSRQFQFEPYTYFNFFADWQPSANSLLSARLHYVPDYTTFMITDTDPKSYEGNTEYAQAEVAFHVLF